MKMSSVKEVEKEIENLIAEGDDGPGTETGRDFKFFSLEKKLRKAKCSEYFYEEILPQLKELVGEVREPTFETYMFIISSGWKATYYASKQGLVITNPNTKKQIRIFCKAEHLLKRIESVETIKAKKQIKKMNDLSIMPFGKYKGQEMISVPSDYLLWLFEENKCYGEIRTYIEENMDVIKSDIKNKKK